VPIDCFPSETAQLLVTTPETRDSALERCEELVARTYAQAYGARITHFLPLLLGLATPGSGLRGVIGARVGTRPEALFLEAYLDRPIQDALSERAGQAVRRSDLAEIGNLSSAGCGLCEVLITTLAAWLDGAEIPWAVFTATAALRRRFERLQIPLIDLGRAPGERMGPRLAEWGSYYATAPRVVATRIQSVREAGWRDERLRSRCDPFWSLAFVEGCTRAVRTGAA
jgi:hypothetical protein